jgi:polysaccharide biosynthesis protein PslH
MANPRILFISPVGFLPPNAGHTARIYRLVNEVERLGNEVWFHGLGLGEQDTRAMRDYFGQRASFSSYLGLHHLRPIPIAILKVIQNRFFEWTDLRRPIDFWFQPHWAEDLGKLARTFHFDAVIAEYFSTSKGLQFFPDSTQKIIDTHDVYHLRPARLERFGLREKWRKVSHRTELKALCRAKTIFAIQDEEAEILRKMLPSHAQVVTVGHNYDIVNVWAPAGDAVIGYLGTANELNVISAQWFVCEVWPKVQALMSSAQLLVGGDVASHIDSLPNVIKLGSVATPAELYRKVRLVVNPMRTGSGLKIKTIEALSHGIPVVSTTPGVAGVSAFKDFSCVRVADEPNEMASAIVKLLASPTELQQMSESAIRFSRFYSEQNRRVLRDALHPKIAV